MKRSKRINNKQRVFTVALFLIWFAVGNVLHQHMGMGMLSTLLFNSIIVPMAMAVPVIMFYDYLGTGRMVYMDSPN